jgi:cell division protein FtsI (penicillin-binding protein 3)
MDHGALAKRLESRHPFVFVSRWVTQAQAERVKELGLKGIGVQLEPRRVYPNRGLAAPLMGFVNIDGIGVRGLEQQEDKWLRGSQRRVPVERDARGRLLADASHVKWDTAGGDIALTIDAALQADAEAALLAAIEATGALGGVAISMNPHTGDVLALAEAPSFDPNHFRTTRYNETRLRSFLDASDPGSAMKAFLLAIALDEDSISPDDRFDCENGKFRVPGSVIHDSHPHGELNVADILRVSSNICAAKIAFALGARLHFEGLQKFGFGRVTGVGFPGESAGALRPWQKWRPLDHATIAFGQGMTVTPIQLAVATAALANGGMLVKPRLVAARRAAQGAWQPTELARPVPVIRPESAAAVVAMMEGVVSPEGTARLAALRGVRVAGKTGTAQIFDPATGTYSKDRFTAWFIGIVPADDPKLVIVAAVDEAKRPLHTGGAAAGPLFAKMASAQLARFGIFTEPKSGAPRYTPEIETEPSTFVAATSDRETVATPRAVAGTAPEAAPAPPPVGTGSRVASAQPVAPALSQLDREVVSVGDRMLLPDFRGLTQTQVAAITARTPLDVKMTGRGLAVTQEPAAGTIVGRQQALVFIHFEKTANDGANGGI